MNARKTLIRLLPLSLSFGLLATACDGGADGAKKDEKAADAKVEAKAEPAKAEEEKPEEAAAEEEKPEEAAAEEEKPEEAAAEEEKPEEAAAEEEKPEEAAAEEEKPDEKKATPKPKPKADKPKADPEPAASSANGKEIYAKKCKSCHGTTGAADTKLAQKHDIGSWKEPGWKGKWSQSKVEDIVKNGKSGTKMKAFKDKLSAEEIVAVSTYARSLGK